MKRGFEAAPPPETAWDVLERFGLALARCEQPGEQVRLTLQAVRDALDADAAFWHPGGDAGGFESAGPFGLTAAWAANFVRRAAEGQPGGQVVRQFLDPGAKPAAPWPCSAALVRVSRARDSWLAALSFHPRRLFAAVDLKVLLLARRMLLARRR